MIDRLTVAPAIETITRAWRFIRVPYGAEVRLLVAGISLGVGLPRLPVANKFFSYAILTLLEKEYFGILFTLLGILLFVTCYKWRLSASGRLISLGGLVLWSMLAFAGGTTTSVIIDACVALALFYEASTIATTNYS